jgi:hypothetical protein
MELKWRYWTFYGICSAWLIIVTLDSRSLAIAIFLLLCSAFVFLVDSGIKYLDSYFNIKINGFVRYMFFLVTYVVFDNNIYHVDFKSKQWYVLGFFGVLFSYAIVLGLIESIVKLYKKIRESRNPARMNLNDEKI